MYSINDKKEAIREIQIYLGSGKYAVIPSGVYDDSTRASVKEFQKDYGLEESGAVDAATFDAIYREYTKQKMREDAKRLSRGTEFPIKFGDSGDKVHEINALLVELGLYYGETNHIRGSFFGKESERITKRLREIFKLNASSEVDEELYLRLIKASEANTNKRV